MLAIRITKALRGRMIHQSGSLYTDTASPANTAHATNVSLMLA